MILMVLCMQMLSNGIVLPYLGATISITKLVSTNQEDAPVESEDNGIEKSTSIDAIEIAKKDSVYPNTKELKIVPLDNTAASYIAVPAAMKIAAPKSNPGLFIPMALAITFPINITIGMPLYYFIISVF